MTSTLHEPTPALSNPNRPQPRLVELTLRYADRYRVYLFALLVLWYLAGFNGQWRVEPDSALYLSIGRSLALGEGYSYHGERHHLAYPGWPYVLGGIFSLFGTQSLLVPHAFMLACGLLTLALTYRLVWLHFDRPTAVMVTIGLGICRTFYRYCFELRNDMPFLLGVMAFLVGYEVILASRLERDAPQVSPRWYDWVLLLGGFALAVVMRPTMWALVGAIVLSTLYAVIRRPRAWPWLVGATVALAGALVFYKLDPRDTSGLLIGAYEDGVIHSVGDDLGRTVHRTLFEHVPAFFERNAPEALFGVELGPGLNTIGVAVLIGLSLLLFRRRVLWGLWIVLTMLVLLVVLPVERYLLPILPLIVLAWWRAIVWVNQRLPGRWGNVAFVAMLVLGSFPNAAKTGGLVIDQHSRPFLRHYKDGRFEAIDKFGAQVAQVTPPNATLICEAKMGRIHTWFAGRKVIDAREVHTLPASPLFVVGPVDHSVMRLVDEHALQMRPSVVETPRRSQKAPWTLWPLE